LVNDLLLFLPAKKIILLKKAEDDFTRKLIKRFKNKEKPSNKNGIHPTR